MQDNGLCDQQRLRSDWAGAQYDQSLHCTCTRGEIVSISIHLGYIHLVFESYAGGAQGPELQCLLKVKVGLC